MIMAQHMRRCANLGKLRNQLDILDDLRYEWDQHGASNAESGRLVHNLLPHPGSCEFSGV